MLADGVVAFGESFETLSGGGVPYSTVGILDETAVRRQEFGYAHSHESIQGTRYNQRGVSVEMGSCDVVEVGMDGFHALSCRSICKQRIYIAV